MSCQLITNSNIAELLALEGEDSKPPLQKAYRRASRRALLWPEEASDILREGRSLTELSGVGPFLEKVICRWIEHSPAVPDPPPVRSDFFTNTEVLALLEDESAWSKQLKGDLQMHSTWSDGTGSIQEMAEAGAARGYEYIAITDHTKGLKIAGGINEEDLERQAEEIAAINEQGSFENFRVLQSAEVNLSPTGSGDMDEKTLSKLDLVLGCFHSSLRKKEDQTERYIAALRNPAIQILGHPRGRIYNFRLGLTADWSRVFDVAASLDKAVEIDAYPDRQDLSVDILKLAKKAGCRISFGTDSHGPSQLRFIDFALAAALSAGIKSDRILNFMNREELLGWVSEVRAARN